MISFPPFSDETTSNAKLTVRWEAVKYIYDHCHGLANKIRIDSLRERNREQDEEVEVIQYSYVTTRPRCCLC